MARALWKREEGKGEKGGSGWVGAVRVLVVLNHPMCCLKVSTFHLQSCLCVQK